MLTTKLEKIFLFSKNMIVIAHKTDRSKIEA